MGKRSNGLYLALRHIYEGKWRRPAFELGHQLFWSALLPVLLVTTTLCFVLRFYLWIRLRWFASARELHHEALCAYQQQSTKKSTRKVHNLLHRAIQRDPTYQPAYLSLAASYLYPVNYPSTQRDPDQALQVLEQCRRNTKGGDDIIRALELDCQVVESGQDHMILDALRQSAYLNRAFAKQQDEKVASHGDGPTSSRSKSQESKKDR